FKPAFLGRTTIVPYFPLPPGIMRRIVTMQLDRIGRRVQENHRAQFSYDPSVADVIAERCTEGSAGARNVEAILSRTLLPELSAQILSRMAEGLELTEVTVVTDQAGAFAYKLS
ncbi:MAG TPA: type VI secretion system ATPase TssH, partial [Acidobacteriaceae bacterium]|nr:type VI secretion system ATPase TssH [Acidobacteriaceae bacterium]